jgi:hypothetical protein
MSQFSSLTIEEIKEKIIEAGYTAVEELLQVAKEKIIGNDNEEDLAADKLKNAAATKKLAIFDAFEILSRIQEEKGNIEAAKGNSNLTEVKFAEGRANRK